METLAAATEPVNRARGHKAASHQATPGDRATGALSRTLRLVCPLIALLLANESSGFDGKDPDPHNDPGALLVDDSDVHVFPVSRWSIDHPASRRSVYDDSITGAGSGPRLLTGRSSGNPDTTFPRPREMAGRYPKGRRRARAAVLLRLRCDEHRLYAGADDERGQEQAASSSLHDLASFTGVFVLRQVRTRAVRQADGRRGVAWFREFGRRRPGRPDSRACSSRAGDPI